MSAPVIAFFSAKRGVGTTSLVYHLAWMLADLGVNVLAVDLDPQAEYYGPVRAGRRGANRRTARTLARRPRPGQQRGGSGVGLAEPFRRYNLAALARGGRSGRFARCAGGSDRPRPQPERHQPERPPGGGPRGSASRGIHGWLELGNRGLGIRQVAPGVGGAPRRCGNGIACGDVRALGIHRSDVELRAIGARLLPEVCPRIYPPMTASTCKMTGTPWPSSAPTPP